MPGNIIAQWLNLPNVKLSEAVTRNGSTEIYLDRDDSLGYICSNCGQISFWGWNLVIRSSILSETRHCKLRRSVAISVLLFGIQSKEKGTVLFFREKTDYFK